VNAPLLRARHLGLATRTGPVFTDVDLTLQPGSLTVVVGPSGTGRSALLLAVTGRMRGLTGSVELRGEARTRPRHLRAVSAVARVAGLVEPEGQLSVGESVTERALVDGVQVADAEAAVSAAEELLGVRFDRGLLVDQLDAFHRTLLSVVLATVRPAAFVVLDDADRLLDLTDQRRLFDGLVRLAAAGPALLVSTTEAAAVPASAHVVHLPPAAAAPPAPPPSQTPKKTA
jgi:ABC-2 type transport system ATP-binding protein